MRAYTSVDPFAKVTLDELTRAARRDNPPLADLLEQLLNERGDLADFVVRVNYLRLLNLTTP